MISTLMKRTANSVAKPLSTISPTRPRVPTLNDYRYFLPFMTRWTDNDMYGHLNNTIYCQYVDGVVNEFLIHHASLNPQSSTNPVGLVINSGFTYRASLEYPNTVIAALAVSKLGRSSVTYSVALFDSESVPSYSNSDSTPSYQDSELGLGLGTFLTPSPTGQGGEGKWKDAKFSLNLRLKERSPAAFGTFTHVYVDPLTRKSVTIPDKAREALEKLVVVIE